MSTAVPALPVDDATMAKISRRLVNLGVVSDEDAPWLTRAGLQEHLGQVEDDVRARGYGGGALTLHSFDRDDEGWATIAYDTERYESPKSAQRVWEEARFERERRDVESRADDWVARLLGLKAVVATWMASSGLEALEIVGRPSITMNEEPMRRMNVKPRQMPAFEIRIDQRPSLRFQPRGLWTLGANGRLDLIASRSSPVLVDRSEPLSGSPQWTIYPLENRTSGRSFSAEICVALVTTGSLP